MKQWIVNRRCDLFVLLGVVFFAIFNGYFYHVYLDAVRDYGGYVVNAIILAKKGIVYDFPYQLPAVGQTLWTNFFTFGQPLGYALYLSLWYRLGGIQAIFWANTLLTAWSFFVLYLIGKLFSNWKGALFSLLFFATNYTTIYLSRKTLSENLMLPLVWTGIYLFLLGYKKKNDKLLLLSFLPIMASLFVRIEGIFYLSSFLFVLGVLIFKNKVDFSLVKKQKTILVFFLMITVTFAFYILLFAGDNYAQFLSAFELPIDLLKTLTRRFYSLFGDSSFLMSGASGPSRLWLISYVSEFLLFYNVLPLLIVLTLELIRGKLSRLYLIVIGLLLPSFYLLYNPSIALDLPWVLRRYWTVIIPFATVLGASILWEKIQKRKSRKIVLVFSLILLSYNIFFSGQIFFQKLGRSQFNELERLAKKIPQNAVLIFSSDYWDTGGRFASTMRYHYSIKTYWPLFFHQNSERWKNGIVSAFLVKKNRDFLKYYLVVEKKGYGDAFLNHLFLKEEVRSFVDEKISFQLSLEDIKIQRGEARFPPTDLRQKETYEYELIPLLL